MTLACFDELGSVTPPLHAREALACAKCAIVIEAAQVDDDIGAAVRESGIVSCFGCGARDSFERFKKGEPRRSVAERWGDAIARHGWTAVPNLLMQHAGRLGLKTTDLAVITALEQHRRPSDDAAVYPSKRRLAQFAGRSPGTVRSSVKRMEQAGMVEVHTRRRPNDSQTSNGYTRNGLTRALDLVAENVAAGLPPDRGLDDLLDALAVEGRERYRLRCSGTATPTSRQKAAA